MSPTVESDTHTEVVFNGIQKIF